MSTRLSTRRLSGGGQVKMTCPPSHWSPAVRCSIEVPPGLFVDARSGGEQMVIISHPDGHAGHIEKLQFNSDLGHYMVRVCLPAIPPDSDHYILLELYPTWIDRLHHRFTGRSRPGVLANRPMPNVTEQDLTNMAEAIRLQEEQDRPEPSVLEESSP